MTLIAAALRRVEAARGRLFVWVPVFLGLGIGLYFRAPQEPAPLALAGLALVALALAVLGWRLGGGAGPVLLALALVAAGVVLGGARSARVAAPVLQYRYYGPVEGRVIAVDRSTTDAVRLTLDRVRLDRMAPEQVPARVRITLHGAQGFVDPAPGMVVATTANLTPPAGPVEPGGFDFQRMAWFRQIGAVGYTRVPVLAMAPAGGGPGLAVARLRARISAWVQARVPGEPGAFAAAILTGDRSAMGQDTLAALRRSNLAHLLAISGLHMGLLTGFVFAALRYALALAPPLALRVPVRKIAAVGALLAGAFYLALSGGNVATQRAFIMVAVMLVAVLMDRRALTLRAVALAAIIVLVLRPEALTAPGFQMSFAATTALVAAFGWLRDWPGRRAPRWARPVLAVVISSAVAGLATAPFAAATFNQVSRYGLLANVLAVPVMGLVVMPGAVLAAVLAPIGLAGLALAMMGPAIRWIMWVAHRVAELDGAVGQVPSPGPWVIPILALGGLMALVLRGHGRGAGLAMMVLAFGLWAAGSRPDLLIAPGGGLVGVMTDAGRALNKPRGDGFAARSWLENDGDAASQAMAAARAGVVRGKGEMRFTLDGRKGVWLGGRGAVARAAAVCALGGVDLVILAGALEDTPPRDCLVIDRTRLATTGALAIRAGPQGWEFATAREKSGRRPWNAAEW